MIVRVILAAVTMACCATPALAHAFLQHAEPGAGAALKAAPRRLALTFSETLEPAFSGVAVTDGSGRSVAAGAVVISGKAIVAPLRPLPPGRYRVTWHVVSVDTHRTEGAYSFMVTP
jgi:methionine-rich copper-binding protein CopC